MELKVWVDGIPKVVCGVTYTTTCQDVVLALACALGQTGRFSLVEKWRDSERPLIPAECPLQSIHSLGEYAGEVRYYLIRAGMDKSGQLQMVNQNADVPASDMQRFRHNFKLPDKSYHHLHSSELIKRSSTFSGAHQSLYGAMSSALPQPSSALPQPSSALPQPSSALPQQRRTQTQATQALPSAVAKEFQLGVSVTSNGKPGSLSPNPITSSSLQSRCGSAKHPPERSLPIEPPLQPQINSLNTFSEDAGKPHLVNIASQCNQDINSSSITHKHNSPQQLKRMSTHQSTQQTFYSNTGKAQSITESLQQHHPSSSQLNQHAATVKPQQRQLSQSSQLPYVTKNSDEKPHPVPPPRHRLAMSSPVLKPQSVPTRVRLKDTQKPLQESNTLNGEHLQSNLACVSHTEINFARSISSDGVESSNVNAYGSKVHAGHPSQHGHSGTTLNHKPSSILRIAREYLQNNGNLPQLGHPSENTQSRAKLKNTSEFPCDSMADVTKYATLDRHLTRSKPHPALRSRSLSSGDDQMLDDKQGIRLQSGSSGDCLQHCVEEKTPHVFIKENSQGSSINKKMSSFASAVAHIRQNNGGASGNKANITHICQHNGGVGGDKANIAHIRQHSEGAVMKPMEAESHVRQHSSDSSYTDRCVKGILTPIDGHVHAASTQWLTDSNNNSKYKDTPLQQSHIKPSLSFNCTSLLHKSAPTQIYRQSSYQEPYLPQSQMSTPPNQCSETVQADRTGSLDCNKYISSNNKDQESSEQVKLECEGSGCDKNSPDMLAKNVAKCNGVNKNEKPNASREDEATLNQADREYSQLLRTVEIQRERIKLQAAHIKDADAEITSLEEKEARNKEQLQAVLEEISSFEAHEAIFKEELDNLDKTEWISVIEKEHELDADLNLQITSLKAKLEQLESQLKQHKDEEQVKQKEINVEEERVAQEKKQNEKLEKQVTSEKRELDEQLNMLNKSLNEKNQQLEKLETEILEADTVLNQKEEQVKSIEMELKSEAKMTNPQTEVDSVAPVRSNGKAFPASDSGEAILKVLECQQTAQSPPTTPFTDEVDNLGGITSAQHLYTLDIPGRTPSGVYV
ncbi:hypothetical protein BsWGS_08366 [Bradybaena similaris]